MNEAQLIQEALAARRLAYAPYSGFMVGAALLDASGTIHHGCNIENSAYSVCNCAERSALFSAVSKGIRQFSAIAVVGAAKGTEPALPCYPCGMCRQALLEFCDPDQFLVLLQDESGTIRRHLLRELLPLGFRL